MLHTSTAIEFREAVAAVVPAIVSVDRIVDEAGERQAHLAAERALDQVLADSFPASDPPSWNPGISRPRPAESFVTARGACQEWTRASCAWLMSSTCPVRLPASEHAFRQSYPCLDWPGSPCSSGWPSSHPTDDRARRSPRAGYAAANRSASTSARAAMGHGPVNPRCDGAPAVQWRS